jgi:magnesium-transporting ATPase (P-type)
MERPPRGLHERVIDADMTVGVVFIGVVMALATLLTIDAWLPGGLIGGDASLERARTMGFTVLVLAQLFNALNSRSTHDSAFRRPFTNPRLWGALALSLGLQVLVVHLPVLNAAFGTEPLGIAEWAAAVAIASSVLWADELRKATVRLARVPAAR